MKMKHMFDLYIKKIKRIAQSWLKYRRSKLRVGVKTWFHDDSKMIEVMSKKKVACEGGGYV